MNVVSFSVFGLDPKYCVGAIKNIDLAEKYYPGWTCMIWHDTSVPDEYLREAEKRKNVQLIDASGLKMPGRYWRFNCFQIKDIQTFCVRDTDSRISQREVDAVAQFIDSGKALHIMRDHPHHNFPVMAGMWSFRNDIASWDIENKLGRWLENIKVENKIDDTNFLKQLYQDFSNNVLVHDNWKRCSRSVNFPSKRDGQRFVGEIFDENDTPEDHYKMINAND